MSSTALLQLVGLCKGRQLPSIAESTSFRGAEGRMSSAVRHPREESQDVIVLDSDDEAPAFKQSEVSLTRLRAHQHAWHALRLSANLRSTDYR